MGTLLVTNMGCSTLHLLKEYNILGRAPNCDVIINLKTLPYLWIEIRYLNGNWIWNVLNGESETIGAGSFIQKQWRKLTKPLRFGNHLSIELVDTSPTEPLIEDDNRILAPLSQYPQIEQISPTSYLFNGQAIQHGKAFVYLNRVYTIWIPEGSQPTEETSTLLPTEGDLWIDLDGMCATFDFETHRFILNGEASRILAVYAQAQNSNDLWLSTEDAFLDWVNLGGNAESPCERINWERNKIMGKLDKQGLFPISSLFRRRKTGNSWAHCLQFEGDIHFEPAPIKPT